MKKTELHDIVYETLNEYITEAELSTGDNTFTIKIDVNKNIRAQKSKLTPGLKEAISEILPLKNLPGELSLSTPNAKESTAVLKSTSTELEARLTPLT